MHRSQAEARHRVPDRLTAGESVPPLELRRLDGDGTVRLDAFVKDRPLVLIFGSCTWPPFRRRSGDLQRLYETYRDRAALFVVYIAEAHPEDEWQMPANIEDGAFCFRQPATFEERCSAARLMAPKLGLTIPTLVDGMDDAAARAFSAWPERIYVVDRDGRVAHPGAPGPRGFKPEEAEQTLRALL